MPSGSSDHRVGATADPDVAAGSRYGPAGFAAALVNILVLEFLTWVLVLAWYMVPIILPPVLIIDAVVAYGLSRTRGTAAQIGHGMLFGCAAAPLTVLIFIPTYVIAQVLGPV